MRHGKKESIFPAPCLRHLSGCKWRQKKVNLSSATVLIANDREKTQLWLLIATGLGVEGWDAASRLQRLHDAAWLAASTCQHHSE